MGSKQNSLAGSGPQRPSGPVRLRWGRLTQLTFAPPTWGPLHSAHPPPQEELLGSLGSARLCPAHTGLTDPPTTGRPLGPPPSHCPCRLRWGSPAHSGRPASRPPRPPRPPQVGPLGQPCSFQKGWAASPQFLQGGCGGGGSAASFDVSDAEARACTPRPTAVEAADPRGPLSRAPALPPPRVGRPRGPAAFSRARQPGGCSHVAGAGGGEPAHGEHLPGKLARGGPGPWECWGSGFEGGSPGDSGGTGVRGRGSGEAPPAAGSPRRGRRSGFFTFGVRRGLYAGMSFPPPSSPLLPSPSSPLPALETPNRLHISQANVCGESWGRGRLVSPLGRVLLPSFSLGSVTAPVWLRRLSSRRAKSQARVSSENVGGKLPGN